MAVPYNSIVLAPPLAPVFLPAGHGASTTAAQYIGLTVQVKEAGEVAPGIYRGSLSLSVTDTASRQTSTSEFTIAIKVDSTPIALAKLTDMAFGAVIQSSKGGAVVLAPGGGRSGEGTVTLGLSAPGTAARLKVTGGMNATYGIILPEYATLVEPKGNALRVDHFTSSPSGSGTLDSSGQQILDVGARLQVPGGQTTGTYTGTFKVTVVYD